MKETIVKKIKDIKIYDIKKEFSILARQLLELSGVGVAMKARRCTAVVS
jgi:hypothetical protein